MTIFWCEDSLDGILTGIYDAWDSRLGHNQVKLKTDAQDTLELFCDYRQVKTDAVKAEKVLRTIRDRLGEEAFEAVWRPGRRHLPYGRAGPSYEGRPPGGELLTEPGCLSGYAPADQGMA